MANITSAAKITQTLIKQTECPADIEKVFVWDTVVKGFGITVTSRVRHNKAGASLLVQNKRFILQFKKGQQTRRITLGEASSISNVDKKRAEALKRKVAAQNGEEYRPKVLAELERQANIKTGQVMEAYSDWMQRMGKQSAPAVRNQFVKHFKTSFPSLWQKPAREFSPRDAKKIIDARAKTSLHEANKIRSYMRTAYQMGIDAEATTDDVSEFVDLGLPHTFANPIIQKPSRNIRASKKRDISMEGMKLELGLYWALLNNPKLPKRISLTLKLHLLTGGQRPAQIVRLTEEDINLSEHRPHVRLKRTKGRSKPLEQNHIIPLTPITKEILREIRSHSISVRMHKSEFSRFYRDHIKTDLEKLKTRDEIFKQIEPFSLAAVRKSSTTFWRQTVPWHIEAMLNDHGRASDIQTSFYDQNDYFQEKLDALIRWEDFILGTT